MFPVVAQFERCSVVGELPTGPWSVVAVDRWHGLGVLGWKRGRLGGDWTMSSGMPKGPRPKAQDYEDHRPQPDGNMRAAMLKPCRALRGFRAEQTNGAAVMCQEAAMTNRRFSRYKPM